MTKSTQKILLLFVVLMLMFILLASCAPVDSSGNSSGPVTTNSQVSTESYTSGFRRLVDRQYNYVCYGFESNLLCYKIK